ncbi:MAG: hypothetical protein R3F59_39280, partial [Myxococcota bacterium]
MRTWCTPCHTAALAGDDRQGAPPGVDFDRWSEVYAWRERIAARATGPDPDMPPLGGVDPARTEQLAAWLACGAQGEDAPPGPCDVRVDVGAATVATQAEADALCAAGNVAASLAVTGDVALDCLCAVDGDVTVGGALSAPRLKAVGGSLRASGAGSLAVPALEAVGGEVALADLVGAGEVVLPALVSVG